MVAEHLHPGGVSGWEVPAFRFRYHDAAFNELGRARQRGGALRPAPGLLGDDCLAFRRNDRGDIVEVLVGEAKCTTDHRADLIVEAHEAFDDSIPMPVSIWQLIEVLKSNPTPTRLRWIEALQEFEDRGLAGMLPEDSRLNLVNYVCGRSPARQRKGAGTGWLHATKPHKGYVSKDRLEAVEIHLSDVTALIDTVYRSPAGWDA